MKKVLITGGSGFIGTNFSELLNAKGIDFLNIDIAPPLNEAYKKGLQNLPLDLKNYVNLKKPEIINLKYPVNVYPKKVSSLKLQKGITYKGKLNGIKGQYLMFEDQSVFNVRSNEGKVVEISIS